jgi:hypothetical protein
VANRADPPGPPQQKEEAVIFEPQDEGKSVKTRIVSIRLPSAIVAAPEQTAAHNRVPTSGALGWLLRTSLGNFELLRGLQDCSEDCGAKLDARIPLTTFEPLRAATMQLGISTSVYIRKLLYHFYVTKRLKYIQSNGRYTLAYSHD